MSDKTVVAVVHHFYGMASAACERLKQELPDDFELVPLSPDHSLLVGRRFHEVWVYGFAIRTERDKEWFKILQFTRTFSAEPMKVRHKG